MNAQANNIDTSDIDSLLDATLDDLADVPEFKPFAKGVHRSNIKWGTKVLNGKTAIELTLTVLETMELANPEDTPPKPGDTTNVMFQFYKKDGQPNEIAQGQFKNIVRSLRTGFNLPETTSNREVMAASDGAEVLAVTGIRTDKKTDPQSPKYYTSVDEIALV